MTCGADDGNDEAPTAFKIACESIARKAEKIKQCDDLHILHAFEPASLLVRAQHEGDACMCAEVQRCRRGEAEHEQKLEAAEEALTDTLLFACADVLTDEDVERCGAAVAKGIGKAFQSARSCIGSDHIHAAAVDAALHERLADVEVRVMQGCDKGKAAGFAEHGTVEHCVLPVPDELGRVPAQIKVAEHDGGGLRKHCRPASACYAPVPFRHEEQGEQQVDSKCNGQKDERHERIADGAEQRTVIIIKKGHDEAEKNNPEIFTDQTKNAARRGQKQQHSLRAVVGQKAEQQREGCACKKRKKALPAKGWQIALAVELRPENADTRAGSHEHENKQVHDRAPDADGGEGFLADIAAYYPGVNRVIELLQKVADDERQGECN